MRKPGVTLALLLCALLLPACTRGVAPGGPATWPKAPVYVYQPPHPADLVYTPADLSEAEQVEWVGMRGAGLPYVTGGPLWSDTDRAGVAHILRLVREAAPVADPQPARVNGPVDSALVIHYRDGREVTVDHAWRPQAGGGGIETVPGRYVISTVGEVASDELDQFYRGTAKVTRVALLPPHSALEAEPYNMRPGDAIRITGHGWVGGKKAVLYWLDPGGRHVLGETPVERGTFTWSGTLPKSIRPVTEHGYYTFEAEVEGVGLGQTTVLGPGR